jgi:hypothetical protein
MELDKQCLLIVKKLNEAGVSKAVVGVMAEELLELVAQHTSLARESALQQEIQLKIVYIHGFLHRVCNKLSLNQPPSLVA